MTDRPRKRFSQLVSETMTTEQQERAKALARRGRFTHDPAPLSHRNRRASRCSACSRPLTG